MRKIIGNVYEEDDYSVFKRLHDNRDVTKTRMGKLIASMTERYVCNPIIVNEKMEVIDGQGRYEARKQMGVPIHYIVAEGATSDDCHRMNKYNTKWLSLDFARSYAKRGYESYVLLLKACKEARFPINITARLASRGGPSSGESRAKFEEGRFYFNEADYEYILSYRKKYDEVMTALQDIEKSNDAFKTAFKICIDTEGYNHARMIKACEQNRSSFVRMSKLFDQLVEFERIYNKGYSPKNRLYFSDYLRNKGANVRNYDNSYSHFKANYEEADVSTLGQE